MKHPETYQLTREEWSEINRALCGASLGLQGFYHPNTREERKKRNDRVRDALDIISRSYDRAKKQMSPERTSDG